MKKVLKAAVVTLLTVAMAAGCSTGGGTAASTAASESAGADSSTPASADAGDARIIQLGHVMPNNDDDQYTYFGRQLDKHLRELSGGAWGIEVVGDSQLGGDRDLFEGMTMGTIDAAIVTNLTFTSSIPETAILELPFLFNDKDTGYNTFNDPAVLEKISGILYDDWNIYTPIFIESGFRETMLGKKVFENIDSFKGLKMRVPESPTYVAAFRSIDANPTTMAFSECYTAIQQGTVDGLEIPVAGIYSSKYHEICEQMVLTNHIYVCGAFCVSRSLWDTLTEEEQGWFNEAAKRAAEEELAFVRETEDRKIDEIAESGCEVTEPSAEDVAAFQAAVEPIYEEYKATVDEEFFNTVMKAAGRN